MALAIGSLELLQVLSAQLGLTSRAWDWLNSLDFGHIGYGIVAAFVVTRAISVLVSKKGRPRAWTRQGRGLGWPAALPG